MLAIPTNKSLPLQLPKIWPRSLRLTRRSTSPLAPSATVLRPRSFHRWSPVRLNTSFMRVELDSFSPSRSEVAGRSEEHTSELQSPDHLVCRLLLEKKKKNR